MRKNNYGYYGYIMVLFIILLVGTYKIINNSYGYFSNIRDVRSIITNVSSFYYDRGSYIQFDNSYLDKNKTIKRSNGYVYPEMANKNNTIYMDQVSFIGNIFYMGLNYDIKDIFGDLEIGSLKKYGQDIYSKKVLLEDERVNYKINDSVIDYYDNYVTVTSASMGEDDYHILTMYGDKDRYINDDDRENIYNKLKDTLYEGDIIVYKEYVLMYVGNDSFIYCTGDSYDYDNKKDYLEEVAIRYGDISELDDKDSEKYLFDSDNFYVFRIGNRYGTWKNIPEYMRSTSELGLRRYFNSSITKGSVPKIKIDKYGDRDTRRDVYENENITYTIDITNNSIEDITIPLITEKINSSVIYVSNSYSDDSYNNGELTFRNIIIPKKEKISISYVVKVNKGEYVYDNTTKIGNYLLNNVDYRIGQRINSLAIINNYNKYNSVRDLYDKEYGIDLDDLQKYRVNYLEGGRDNDSNEERIRYIDKNMFLGGDILYDDDRESVYIEDNGNSFFYDYRKKEIITDVSKYLEELLGSNNFYVVRPRYGLNGKKIDFGELEVLLNDKLIIVKDSASYEDIIKKISNYQDISIVNRSNEKVAMKELVKTGERIEIDGDSYYIVLSGDINGDGKRDTADVLKLHRYILGRAKIEEKYFLEAGYINSDRIIDTADVLKLHRYVLGRINSL